MREVDYMRTYGYLSEREAEIIFYRDEKKLTYEQIGNLKELSSARIRQIYNKAMNKINKYGEVDVFDFYLSLQSVCLDEHTKNCLFNAGIFTIPQLYMKYKELGININIDGIGKMGERRIEEAINIYGLLSVRDHRISRDVLYDFDEVECAVKLLLYRKARDFKESDSLERYIGKYLDSIQSEESVKEMSNRVWEKMTKLHNETRKN